MMSSSKTGEVGKGVMEKLKSVGPSAAVDAQSRTKVILNPDRASCEGNSEICLIFDDEMRPAAAAAAASLIGVQSGGRVEVCVRTKEKCDRILATKVNERTFFFLAPNNREGDASVVVFVNGTEVASSYLRYRSSDTVHLVAGLSQIYLQFLSTVCRYMYALQTKHQIPSPMPELDRLLAESFEDKDSKHNIPPKAFEELFDILRHSSTEVIESNYEFPTLLHLTGAYGLEQLAIKLLDLPGATRACSVFNSNKKTATELARDNGHQPVVRALGAASKVQARSGPVELRPPSFTQTRDLNVKTLMPGDQRFQRQQSPDSDYMLPDRTAPEPEVEDNYMLFTQPQQPSTTPRKPPPAPCPKSIQSKSVSVPAITPVSSPPTILPRSSVGGTAAPPVPRRESRDSGVNVDDAPGPIRKRPPLTKVGTEPSYTYDDEGHFVTSRRGSQDTAAGNAVQRNLSVSGEEIARQLKKSVHAHPGSRGPSITK